ncbi:RNA-directed DNA polymerase, eukaryota, reverse transcriptase zinc-binding domain protein, partial [Tanacetum coccineum]
MVDYSSDPPSTTSVMRRGVDNTCLVDDRGCDGCDTLSMIDGANSGVEILSESSHDIGSNKATWVKWSDVLAPKKLGGLGVSSLYALNRGLLFKWLWKFYAQATSLWARVIKAIHGVDGNIGRRITSGNRSCWTSIISEAEVLKQQGVNFFDFMQLNMGNGELTSFWEDKWHDSFVLKDLFPRLYVLETNKKMYVWSLDNSGSFSVASLREVIDAKRYVGGKSSTRWVKYVPIKVNVMAWKIKLDAIPTRINMSRRGIDLDSLSCPICECGIESVGHLFFQCQVVRQVVRKISFWWNVDYVDFNSYEEWLNWLISLRLTAKYKELLEGVFYVLWWLIWSFRNKIIFEAKPPSKAAIFDNVVSSSFYWDCIHVQPPGFRDAASRLVLGFSSDLFMGLNRPLGPGADTAYLLLYVDGYWFLMHLLMSVTAHYHFIFMQSLSLYALPESLISLLSKGSYATTTLVYCDNVSAVYLSSNPVQHQRMKHIEIDIHFVRDLVATGAIRVLHVPSRYEYADIFTKGLPTSFDFRKFKNHKSNSHDTAYRVEQDDGSHSIIRNKRLYSDNASEIDEKKPELKNLPSHLEYAYLHDNESLPVIISSKLSGREKKLLLHVLEKHKGAIAWKMSDIKGISPSFCTYKILIEDDFKPVIQPQRGLNPKVQDVVKDEIVKLLDSGLIYPIS